MLLLIGISDKIGTYRRLDRNDGEYQETVPHWMVSTVL